jgi:peptide/nickel transport system permease protein
VSRYVVRRVLAIIPITLLVTFVAFILVSLVPGDAAKKAAGEFATPEQVQQVRSELGLDKPLLTRYVDYLGDLAHGDMGRSVAFQPGRPVVDIIGELVPTTLSLTLVTMVFTLLLGFPLGTLAALRRGTRVDHAIGGFVTIALAVPPFVMGPLLVTILAVNNRVFPALGYTKFGEDPGEWLWHLILPAIALGLNPAAELARQVRAALVGELDQSYVRTARAKGLSTRKVVGKHALKNAGIAAVTVLGLQVGRIIGGSVIIETIFALPGLGQLAYTATFRADFPVIQGLILVSALFVLVINLVTDLSYLYFDPKLRDPARH